MNYSKLEEECSHTECIEGHWEESTYIDYDGSSQVDHTWKDGWDKPTSRDINIHQYQCTQCGKISNY